MEQKKLIISYHQIHRIISWPNHCENMLSAICYLFQSRIHPFNSYNCISKYGSVLFLKNSIWRYLTCLSTVLRHHHPLTPPSTTVIGVMQNLSFPFVSESCYFTAYILAQGLWTEHWKEYSLHSLFHCSPCQITTILHSILTMAK